MTSPLESRAVVIALESAVRSLAMAGVVWMAIRLFRLRNLPAQKLAWTLVLALSCAMPGLLVLESAHPDAVPTVKFAAATRVLASLATQYDRVAHRVHALRSVVQAASTVPSTQPEAAAPAPLLSAQDDASPADVATSSEEPTDAPAVLLSAEPSHPVARWHLSALTRFIVPAYLAVSAVLMLRVFFGLLLAARLWRQAEPASVILDPRATVRISASIESPVTIGSGIVLPASSSTWDRRRLHMVLAHERAHVRQGDFYLQLAAALYAALTWISPLGWLLKRELAELGEAVSDRAALDEAGTVSSTDYAELLLEFAAMPRRGFAQAAAGVGMARPSSVQGRIERILNPRAFAAAFTGGRTTTLAAAILVPCALLMAVSVRRAHAQAQTAPQPAMPAPQPAAATIAIPRSAPEPALAAAPASAPAHAASMAAPARASVLAPAARPAASITGLSSTLHTPAPALAQTLQGQLIALNTQVAPIANLALSLSSQDAAPGPASSTGLSQSSAGDASTSGSASGSATSSSSTTQSFDDDEDDHDRSGHHSTGVLMLNGPNSSFAIVRGDARVSGKGTDGDAFEKARKQANGDMIWFERNGKSYIITDPATIDAGVRQWHTARAYDPGPIFNLAMTRANEDWQTRIKPMNLDVKIPPIPAADVQKRLAEAESTLKKLQAEYPQGKSSALTPEQQGELRREVSEIIASLSQLEISGMVNERVRIEINDQMRKQMEDSRQAMDRAREQSRQAMEQARDGMRKAREEARRQSSQQMQSFFDQALRDGKARQIQ